MKLRLIKTVQLMKSDELLKCFIASSALFMRKIHNIQMKEFVSCKYLTFYLLVFFSLHARRASRSERNLNLRVKSKNNLATEWHITWKGAGGYWIHNHKTSIKGENGTSGCCHRSGDKVQEDRGSQPSQVKVDL